MEKEKPSRTALNPKRVFVYSYITSLAVAFIVVVIWLVVLFNYSSLPQSQLRTSPPDILELVFLCVTTLPSVLAFLRNVSSGQRSCLVRYRVWFLTL
jgi:hypothetical protein